MNKIHVSRLRCEYRDNPLGIETLQPRLSWILISSAAAPVRQSAYQIEVRQASGEKVWDSGKIRSAENAQVIYAGNPLQPKTNYQWKVRVWEKSGAVSPWSATALWSMGLFYHTDAVWPENWIGAPLDVPFTDTESQPCPLVRNEFKVDAEIVRATVYATALGVYELRINGKRVGEQVLAPEWTDYRKRVQYQTYDVTTALKKGRNAIGAILGQGWYAGRIGLAEIFGTGGGFRGVYGRHLRLFCILEVETIDGKTQTLISNRSWKYTLDGPIRGTDILDGETYDARREIGGWDRPGFDDAKWANVAASNGPELVPQANEPIKVTRTLAPRSVTKTQSGSYVFDLGQNMVGWVKLKLKAPAGTKIQLQFGEVLKDDGSLYRDNLRNSPQTDVYICHGKGVENFEPHFTYHGFRYVEVQGLKTSPSLKDLIGCVIHSSGRDTGEFACSSDLLTRLMSAIQWTQRGNLISTPTDCPQRDERLGWLGDIQVFSQTACFNMDMAAFFTKWLRDVRDAQTGDGRFPDYAPHPYSPELRFSGNAGWGDAGVIVPWRAYVNYNDVRILEESFPAAQRWIEYIHRHNPDLIWRHRQGAPLTYGDWLNGDTFKGLADWPSSGGEVPKEIYATSFFAYSTEILSRTAQVLGHKKEAARYASLAKKIRAAYCAAFVSKDGKIQGDTQAGYALALHFDLLPAKLRPLAVRHMVDALKPYNGSMSTGIQSTVRLMLELSRFGHHDEAYHLINKTTMPSWGYMIENGGTTIWERWDGWVKGRGYQDPSMNSFNHYAIGAVGEWMWKTIIGLHPDEANPGWRHFFIKPVPGGGLTWARGKHDSVHGPIHVEWRIKQGRFEIEAEVPANSTATLTLPEKGAKNRLLRSGRHRVSCAIPT